MTLITKPDDLSEVCKQLDASGRFGLDLEFIPERTYAAQLCLVQVATDDDVFLIDPLALPDLTALWQRIADPNLLKVLHAADQDLDLMFTASGLLPNNVLDTQIAAGFVGFGYPVGYGKLLQQLLGISISKTESYTDWTHRPLSQSQVEYAVDDVRHLLPIYDRLKNQLNQMNRLSWVQEECKKYSDPTYYERDRDNDFFRIKGANSLNRRGLAVLKELSDWRHEEAARVNKPLKSILQDGILLEFARRPPKEFSELQRIRGIRPDQLRQYGNALLAAIKTGLAVPDNHLPRWPAARVPSRREVLMADVLYTALRVICFDLDIATELVATRGILEGLVKRHVDGGGGEADLPILKGWRHEMAGRQLLEVLNGASLQMQFRDDEHPISMKLSSNAQTN
jgi:ribonuclease D